MPLIDFEKAPAVRFPVGPFTQTTQVSRLMEFGPWTRNARERVRALANLELGWDGKNASPIRDAARGQVFGIIDALTKLGMPAPHIVPIPNGGIQLEWRNNVGEFEIEVSPEGAVGFLVVDSEGEMLAGDVPDTNNAAALTPVTSWFLDGKERVCDLIPYAAY